MNQKYEESIKIAEDIINDVYSEPYLVITLQKYYSLVKLIGHKKGKDWVRNEIYGYKDLKTVPNYRKIKLEKNYYVCVLNNCDQIYHKVMNEISSYHVAYHNQKPYNDYLVKPDNYQHILYIVRNMVHERTIHIYHYLKFDKVNHDIFEDMQKFVNKTIKELNPILHEDLQKVYQDLSDGEKSTDWQTISYQCRLILQNFADSIYEPEDTERIGFDEKPHPVGKNNYINRITAYIELKVDSETEKKFLISHIQYLHSFLENLYKITNKGTHEKIEREHANRCVIYTYLIIGDILNITSN